ncbi:hypothetical protein [uncultured Microscilla sp.]|uniref:hypothetical protein n=1 Tax=uncultured Microscilla sp. TaxID=432653 RepID=UPI00262946CA|nr:hypothetical protein [uncultured Microscilla sp.]
MRKEDLRKEFDEFYQEKHKTERSVLWKSLGKGLEIGLFVLNLLAFIYLIFFLGPPSADVKRLNQDIKDLTKTIQIINSRVTSPLSDSLKNEKNKALIHKNAELDKRVASLEQREVLLKYIDQKAKKIDDKLNIFKNYGIPLGALSLMILVFSFYKQIKPLVAQSVKEQSAEIVSNHTKYIENQLKDNQKAFNKILANQKFQDKIVELSRILILYDDPVAYSQTKKMLFGMGFQETHVQGYDVKEAAEAESKFRDIINSEVEERKIGQKTKPEILDELKTLFPGLSNLTEKDKSDLIKLFKEKLQKQLTEQKAENELLPELKEKLLEVRDSLHNYNLIIFDEHTENLRYFDISKKDKVWETCIKQEIETVNYLYYGKGKSQTKNKYAEIVHAANAPITLPARIQEVLIYQNAK